MISPHDSVATRRGPADLAPQPDRAIRFVPRSGPSLYVAPLVVFVATRLLLELVVHIQPQILHSLHKNRPVLPRGDVLAHAWSWFSPWFRFDARWYVGIAQHGYHWGSLGHANTNFMPLYPALIRLFQPVTLGSPWLSALVVANLAFLAAMLAIWRWALLRWDTDVALRALLLVTVFPFTFFFVTPYAEPLFLALAAAAFLFAEEDRWALAVCAAGLSTITRPVGLAVVLGLVVYALARGQRGRAALALLGVLPLLVFVVYLTVSFGQPLGFLTYHSAGWVPPHGGILTTIGSQFHTHLSPLDRLDAALAAIFLASAVLAWRRLGPGYGVYTAVGVLLPLVHGLVSMERYVIVLFPAVAAWATWKNRAVQAALFSLSLLLLLMASIMFAAGVSLF